MFYKLVIKRRGRVAELSKKGRGRDDGVYNTTRGGQLVFNLRNLTKNGLTTP